MRRCVATWGLCLALVALLLWSVTALGWPGTALAEPARPTANPAGTSPSEPDPTGPPLGRSPDGGIIGGAELGSRGLALPPDAPPLPADISARGWLIADATSGEVLAANDAHGRYYPASTLKLLTLLSLHPRLEPAEVVTATVDDERIEGSRVGLIHGGQYDVATLWLALMLQSGNDAANALSRTAGGLEPTLEAMYATADRLRAYDTSPGGPSGLDVEGQRSSPYDLALMMTAAVADPELLAIMGAARAQIPAVPGMDEGFEIQNQNQLLANYPGAIAGKTGFTDAARYTFVAAADRDGRRLVVSLMQAEQVPIPTWEQAARLLDWGFALPGGLPAVGELVSPGSPEESAGTGAAGGGAVPATAADPLAVGSGQLNSAGRSSDTGSGVLPALALGIGSTAIVAGTAFSCRTHPRGYAHNRGKSGPGTTVMRITAATGRRAARHSAFRRRIRSPDHAPRRRRW